MSVKRRQGGLAGQRDSQYRGLTCAHCDKDARDQHYRVTVVPDGTDPLRIHRIYDPMVVPVIVYHHRGH
jgi:hypothetical protein